MFKVSRFSKYSLVCFASPARRLFLLFLLAGPAQPSTVRAQNPDSVLSRKYFEYRERLMREFFTGIGDGFGHSIPASVRATWDKDYAGRHTMSWGDATIDLAWYIGVLATEYHLLSNTGQSTRTLEELYYAMEAMNRLDRYANGYFGEPDSLDGFFVRSDVGRGLFTGDQPGESYSKALRRVNRFAPDTIRNLRSEWISHYLHGKDKRFAASKDQVIQVFAAMMLVKKCIPPGISFENRPFMDGEIYLAAEAGHITDRIMNWMHPSGKSNFITNWRLRRPDGRRVGAGFNAWSFAHGLSLSQQSISGTRNPRKKGFSYWISKAVYNFSWFAYKPVFFFSRSEGMKILTLVATNNSCKGNARKVYRRAMAFKKYAWYHIPLLYGFIHGRYTGAIDRDFYRELLDRAPREGPHNTSETGYSVFDWSSTSLIIHPERRGQVKPYFPGRYNGLDYMLLYNLYLAYTGQTY